VKINGKPMLACELLVENAVQHFRTTVFQVEPLTVAPVVRDLVIDLEKAYEKVHKAKPFIIEAKEKIDQDNAYPISPREIEHYVDATRCINCFCCASACMSSHRSFIGPNAVMASVVRLMDPRERAKDERLKLLYSEAGVYRCHTSRACSFVCPKEIDVAHFIALAKEGRFKSS
jgi:succinate dehydrogenase / fumarate reductase iron-sulfur subunit